MAANPINAPGQSSTSLYFPTDFFTSAVSHRNRILLVLNQPIANRELLDRLWRSCDYRLCADGGANQLHDLLVREGKGKGQDMRQRYLPDVIHGDLDSLRSDVHSFYAGAGVPVSRNSDQYSTDFGKAVLKILSEHPAGRALAAASNASPLDVVILGSVCGRVDQGLGLLHEMAREMGRRPGLRLWLVSEASLSFVLPGGLERCVIDFQAAEGAGAPQGPAFGREAGILPLYGAARIWTSGFEWDVRDWETSMGGEQVSTSNHVVRGTVEIMATERVLFTIARNALLPPLNE